MNCGYCNCIFTFLIHKLVGYFADLFRLTAIIILKFEFSILEAIIQLNKFAVLVQSPFYRLLARVSRFGLCNFRQLSLSHHYCYILMLLAVIKNPHQRTHSPTDLSGVRDAGMFPREAKSHPDPPLHCLQPTLIASFSTGSALFIITSNTPLSTCTTAKCQLPSEDCNSTRECKGKWKEPPTEAATTCSRN